MIIHPDTIIPFQSTVELSEAGLELPPLRQALVDGNYKYWAYLPNTNHQIPFILNNSEILDRLVILGYKFLFAPNVEQLLERLDGSVTIMKKYTIDGVYGWVVGIGDQNADPHEWPKYQFGPTPHEALRLLYIKENKDTVHG